MTVMPATPTAASVSRIRIGFLPPMRSTMAPKGILSSEPVSAGQAARMPIRKGSTSMACLSFGTMGPNAETPANPAKNASVVHASAARGFEIA